MQIKIIHNAAVVYEFLKDKPRYDYIYQFNNLAADVWEKVICYGLFEGTKLKEIAMVNINYGIPVLLAASHGNDEYCAILIKEIKRHLPSKFYTHIDKKVLKDVFSPNIITDYHEYINMGLVDYSILDDSEQENIAVKLDVEAIELVKELLAVSYPDAWLDEASMGFGKNYGIFADGKLVSFAGLHAYSEQYQVAAVAHVTTHPDYRGKGYGNTVMTALLMDIRDNIRYIGLNVKVDNLPAINCYKKLGFKEFGSFVDCNIQNHNI